MLENTDNLNLHFLSSKICPYNSLFNGQSENKSTVGLGHPELQSPLRLFYCLSTLLWSFSIAAVPICHHRFALFSPNLFLFYSFPLLSVYLMCFSSIHSFLKSQNQRPRICPRNMERNVLDDPFCEAAPVSGSCFEWRSEGHGK